MTLPTTKKELAKWLVTDTPGFVAYSSDAMKLARDIAFKGHCQRAEERGAAQPADLSGACKFSSMFVKCLFGGIIRGNDRHQFNIIDNLVCDLNADAADVKEMVAENFAVYAHDDVFFANPGHLESLFSCMPRVQSWVERFRAEHINYVPSQDPPADAQSASPDSVAQSTPLSPLTPELFKLAMTLQAAKNTYMLEEQLAEQLGLPGPQSWERRIRELFIVGFAGYADAIGVRRRDEALQALLGIPLDDDLKSLPNADLPRHFAIDFKARNGEYLRRLAPKTSPSAPTGPSIG